MFCETRVGDVTKAFKDFVMGIDSNKIEIYKDDNLFELHELVAAELRDSSKFPVEEDDLNEIDFN
jgi:hypothetical protein